MIEIAMERRSLPSEFGSFPAPYRLRGYESGDAATWMRLQEATGIYPRLKADLFQREFADGPEERQFFLMLGDDAVATGTAWHGEPLRNSRWGRLHWIAVHPLHQRKGLGFQLCHHLLAVLRDFGCTGAFLTTGSTNSPAISLYRKLGFRPWIRSPEEALFWGSGQTR